MALVPWVQWQGKTSFIRSVSSRHHRRGTGTARKSSGAQAARNRSRSSETSEETRGRGENTGVFDADPPRPLQRVAGFLEQEKERTVCWDRDDAIGPRCIAGRGRCPIDQLKAKALVSIQSGIQDDRDAEDLARRALQKMKRTRPANTMVDGAGQSGVGYFSILAA